MKRLGLVWMSLCVALLLSWLATSPVAQSALTRVLLVDASNVPVPLSTGGSGPIDSGTGRMTIATDDPVNDFAVLAAANMVAHGASDAGNPLKIGAKTTATLAGASLVTAGQRSDLMAGLDGVLIVRPYANNEDIVQDTAQNTNGTSTAFAGGLAAAGSGVRLYVTDCDITNTSATGGTVDLKDGSAGSTVWTLPVPAAPASSIGAVVKAFATPLRFSANTAVAYDVSAAISTVTISCNGFKSKV